MTSSVGLAICSSERGGFASLRAEVEDLLGVGAEVVVLAPLFAGEPPALPPGARFEVMRGRARTPFRTVPEIRAWMRARDLDVVHLHGRAAGLLGRLAAVGLPVSIAYSAHGIHPPLNSALRVVERTLQRLLRTRTDLFVMIGDGERQDFDEAYGFGGRPVVVMPNVVDPSAVRNRVDRFRFPRPTIVAPGAYHPKKRFGDILRAVAAGRVPRDVDVRLYGNAGWDGGRSRRALEALAADLAVADRVHLEDETSELPSLLASADLVVLPSEREGLPLVALEAAAVGAPVAWSDIRGHREVFDGYARSFAVGDIVDLARILRATDEWPSWRIPTERADELYRDGLQRRREAVDTLLGLARRRR